MSWWKNVKKGTRFFWDFNLVRALEKRKDDGLLSEKGTTLENSHLFNLFIHMSEVS